MADFVDNEAEESSGEEHENHEKAKKKKSSKESKKWQEEVEREMNVGRKKKRNRAKAMEESDEDEEDDEDRLHQELKDLINDDSSESEVEDTYSTNNNKKRKRNQNASFDDRLEDDDYDLLEENLGITVKRKKRFKRLRRIKDIESDEEEQETDVERDAIANKLFDGSDNECDRRSTSSHNIETVTFPEVGSEPDFSDADDFIVDNNGRSVAEKRRKKRAIFDDAALQEAQDIFGVDFDYDAFDKYGEEDADEEDDEYIDDDIDGERNRHFKKTPKSKGTKKTIFEIYEPSELKRGHFTEVDNEIRNTDIPERMQLRSVPVTPVPEGSDELDLEAEWIYKRAFCRPAISIQDAHLTDEAKERARKGPQAVGKIKKALDFMRNQNFEVPFISFYRKEHVNPELNINDLWKVYRYDAMWCELRQRKQNMLLLFEKIQAYQLDEIMKKPDAPLPDDMRVIKDEDIDWLKSVETSEELNDVHNHFMLYYSHEVPKMQAEVRLRQKKARELARLEKRQQEINSAMESSDRRYPYTIEPEIDENENGNEILKQATRTGPYAMCRKAGLIAFATKFGLTPEQFAENLRDNYQRHEVEQDPIEPRTVALDYCGPKFPSPEDVIGAVQLMVAIQLAREPLVRKCIREIYMERAKISVAPTNKGIKDIDENHAIYTMKYLKNKPVTELVGDEFMKLSMAENDKLITISFSDIVEGATSGNYMEEMKQLYHRDEFSKNVKDWNALRGGSIAIAYERLLIPDMKKELRSNLLAEAKEFVLRSCCRKMYNWIKVAPYVCNFEDELETADDEEEWDAPTDESNKKTNKRENDEDWNTSKGIRVMGVAYVPEHSQAAFACIVAPSGDCTDYLKLPHLLIRKNSLRENDQTMKEADLLAIRNFIASKKPHVIVLGGESREATWIAEDIKECISTLIEEQQFPSIKIEICENELAKIYANGNRGSEEFRDYPIILREAISLARRLQDPLIEFSKLCGLEEEILCIKYHPYQDQLSKEELLENIYLEFVNRVNEVGVDLNAALQHGNLLNLIQFVCGLGSRKAQALVKILKVTNKRIENRTQLVTSCHMGPKIFINCAGFIKIDIASLGDSTESYVEVLDSTRVHPETYEWARKMAIDALEYDDDEGADRAGAVEEIMGSSEKLKDLDLDAFAEELERQGFGNKRITLYDIRAELSCPYKDLRVPYESPTPEKLFDILSKETPETFYIGKLILATVSMLNRRKPEDEQLDQANPVRNENTDLWQCPFCLKDDFPELSEVWSHFDSGTCPGKAIGVKVRLENGISGYINVRNLSDKNVTNPEERVRPGQVIHCRIIKIEVDRFSVECTSRSSDLADKSHKFRPQYDLYYDTEAEEKIHRAAEEMKANKQRQTYIKRVIVHSAFHNINYAETAKMMETMKLGEAIVRPSSKGCDHLTVTWKVTHDILHHIDVKEVDKQFAFSLGKRLFIGDEEYEDLDEIIARHINPMAAYVSELLDCHYYKQNLDGLEEKAEEMAKEQKRENFNRIPCLLSASKKYPSKFLLSYLPRERCIHEYISVKPNGVRFRGRTFARVGELFRWFRKHFRDPLPVATPKVSVYTPGVFAYGVEEPVDDLDHHTLSMVSTPSVCTPGRSCSSQYASSYPMTPRTPSATNLFGSGYHTQGTPKYAESTSTEKQDKFAYPGAPVSRGFQQKFRSDSSGNYTDWKRNSYGSTAVEGSCARGLGRGSRGGRGFRGRGRGGQNTSFNSSRSSYRSNNSSMGDSTPLWDEISSENSSQATPNSYHRNNNRGSFNASPNPSVDKDTPLWDASESWDDPEPVASAGNGSKVANNSITGETNNNSGGNRTPLWDAGDSWDDPEPVVPAGNRPKTANNSTSGGTNKNAGNRTPLWEASDSWDDPEPVAPVGNGSKMVNESTTDGTNKNLGSRTPLWEASENWDDSDPALPAGNTSKMANNSTTGAMNKNLGNRAPLWNAGESWADPEPVAPAGNRSKMPNKSTTGGTNENLGNRMPLWDASESWDGPDAVVPGGNRSQMSNNSITGGRNTSLGARTPLWEASESWDGPEPVVPAGNSSKMSNKSTIGGRNTNLGNRTPLWEASESWDGPEPVVPAGNTSKRVNNFTTGGRNTNLGNRTPLWEASESWDDPEPVAPRSKPNPAGNTSFKASCNTPLATSGTRSTRPIGSRTPLYNTRKNCNEPKQAASRQRAPLGRNSYDQTSRNISRSLSNQTITAPPGSRTPLYDASESWDDPEPVMLQNKSSPLQHLSTKLVDNVGASSASCTALHAATSRNISQSLPNQTITAPPGSRTPLYDASESWDDPEPVTHQNKSIPLQNLSTNLVDNVGPSSSSRTALHAVSSSWDGPKTAARQYKHLPIHNSPRQSFERISHITSGSSNRTKNRGRAYSPMGSWNATKHTRQQNRPFTRQNPTRQPFGRGPRGNSDSWRGRPNGNRERASAPLPLNEQRSERNSHQTGESTTSEPQSLAINVNRSPLYDESESWD